MRQQLLYEELDGQRHRLWEVLGEIDGTIFHGWSSPLRLKSAFQ
jgi:hypothetical protein